MAVHVGQALLPLLCASLASSTHPGSAARPKQENRLPTILHRPQKPNSLAMGLSPKSERQDQHDGRPSKKKSGCSAGVPTEPQCAGARAEGESSVPVQSLLNQPGSAHASLLGSQGPLSLTGLPMGERVLWGWGLLHAMRIESSSKPCQNNMGHPSCGNAPLLCFSHRMATFRCLVLPSSSPRRWYQPLICWGEERSC